MRLFLLALFCFSSIARADYSLMFDRIPVIDLARIVYGEILKVPYIISPTVISSSDVVSLKLQESPARVIAASMAHVLEELDIAIEIRSGVRWLVKRGEKGPMETEFIYTPRHRSVSYLLDVVSGFFPVGSFPTQRGLGASGSVPIQGVSAMPAQVRQQSEVRQQQARNVVDTGSSAFSFASKNPDVLMFKGTEQQVDKLRRLLDQVDTAVSEMLVKAVVFEVVKNQGDSSGFGLALSVLGGRLGVSLGSVKAGDFSAVFKTHSFSVVVDALKTDSRFKVVSSPQLRVSDGAKSRLMVGSETPVLGAVTVNNGSSQQSVEYRSSGVIFELQPSIYSDRAEFQITQQISDFQRTTTGVEGSPTLVKRELSTTVGVSSGDVIVLGGLQQEREASGSSGLSWLPLFGSKASDSQKTEVLLLMEAQRI